MKENVLNSYLAKAEELIRLYLNAAEQKFTPLHLALKQYFKQHSKFGKRDRNAISDLVYAYFRCGHTFQKEQISKRILLGAYLCYDNENSVFHHLLNYKLNGDIPSKEIAVRIDSAKKLFQGFDPAAFMPFKVQFSDGITEEQYFHSFLKKPATFIRISADKHKDVLSELAKNEINWQQADENAFKIDSAKNLTTLGSWEKGLFEIQDLSSQQTAAFMHPQKGDKWWDVCAASGGKSLLLLSKQKDLFIFASDIRESILKNYEERLKRHNFLNFKTAVINTAESFEIKDSFNGIICDVPCSGSGTWHRTPENLFFFKESDLEHYSSFQKKILENTIAKKNPETAFLYITCSVFEAENEKNVDPFKPAKKQLINNLDLQADAMFIAEL